ncbi:MAG: FmdE family protein [Thermodesulfobacteriota bacterium]|nr:FmdE family protein [Thermodesulfobacteriota bacterium]
MYSQEYQKLIGFHGHSCPGLALGYRMVKAAMEKTHLGKAGDEETVTIVENDSCSVDAVQFLLGCTFGKGNLIFKDHGKQVFTFITRPTGKALRVSLLPHAMDMPEGDTKSRTQMTREEMVEKILSMPEAELLKVKEVSIESPEKAQIHSSFICDLCGEPIMETRMIKKSGKTYCIPCADNLSKEPS